MSKKPSEYLKRKRNFYRKKLVEMFGSRCEICGYCKCLQALEFHHRDKKTKRFKLSGIDLTTRPFRELIEEAKKCQLLCANHHAEIEAGQTHTKENT
jgi:hypothetical protein